MSFLYRWMPRGKRGKKKISPQDDPLRGTGRKVSKDEWIKYIKRNPRSFTARDSLTDKDLPKELKPVIEKENK